MLRPGAPTSVFALIERLTTAADEAMSQARASMHEATLRNELGLAYGQLGRRAFALVDVGALATDLLVAEMRRVRALEAELAALAGQASR